MYISEALDHDSTVSAKCAVCIDFQKQKTCLLPFQTTTLVALKYSWFISYRRQHWDWPISIFHSFSRCIIEGFSFQLRKSNFAIIFICLKHEIGCELVSIFKNSSHPKELFYSVLTILSLSIVILDYILCTVSSPDNYCCSLSPQPLKALCNIILSSLVKMPLQISVMLILLVPCFWPEVEYIALLEQMESGLCWEIAWLPAKRAAPAAATGALPPRAGAAAALDPLPALARHRGVGM